MSEVWGSVPEIVSAVATCAALAAAIWAGRTAKGVHDIEAGRDRAAENDRRRQVADLVSAYVATHFLEGSRYDGLTIENRSTAAIREVAIRSCRNNGNEDHPLGLVIVPPGKYFVARVNTSYHWDFPKSVKYLRGEIRPIMKTNVWRVLEMAFTDSAGVAWCRDERGALAEVHPSRPLEP